MSDLFLSPSMGGTFGLQQRNVCWWMEDLCVHHLAVVQVLFHLKIVGRWNVTSSLAVALSSVKTAGRATMMGHATQSQLRPQVTCHRSVDHLINALAEKAICENLPRVSPSPQRVLWWTKRRLSEGGGMEPPCSSCRSRLNAVPNVLFLWREMVRN